MRFKQGDLLQHFGNIAYSDEGYVHEFRGDKIVYIESVGDDYYKTLVFLGDRDQWVEKYFYSEEYFEPISPKMYGWFERAIEMLFEGMING
jgi:hypothetical protein